MVLGSRESEMQKKMLKNLNGNEEILKIFNENIPKDYGYPTSLGKMPLFHPYSSDNMILVLHRLLVAVRQERIGKHWHAGMSKYSTAKKRI